VVLVDRVLSALILVMLADWPVVQAVAMFGKQMVFLLALVWTRPMA